MVDCFWCLNPYYTGIDLHGYTVYQMENGVMTGLNPYYTGIDLHTYYE